jgi:hypothetical protein
MSYRFLVALVVAAVQVGCASVSVERGKDLSSAGIAYSQATAAVIDLAIDASIDASSESQIRKKMAAPTSDDQRKERTEFLAQLDGTLVDNVRSYVKLKRSVSAVEAYFAGLQALAGANPGPAAEAAVGTLVDRVNGLNAALEAGKPISEEKKGAIAGLAGLLVKQAHGAAVARALERDAQPIGRALVLQELTLRAAASDIAAAMNNANARFYQDRVIRPYVEGGIGGAWAEDRRVALKTRAMGSTQVAVESAATAAAQMQAVWGRILSGETSGQEFLLIVRDVQELLDAANALKRAQ